MSTFFNERRTSLPLASTGAFSGRWATLPSFAVIAQNIGLDVLQVALECFPHIGDEHSGGDGIVAGEEVVEINIPAGVDDGMVVTVPGKGGAGKHNGVNGDLQVIVRVEKNENFERKDKDLYYNLILDFSTAVLGGEVEIPTLEGKTTIKIEPGTQPGKRVRLRGKGMPAIQGYGYGRGDIIVNITVYIPKTLNKEEKELVKKFKECENFQADKATKKSLFDSIKNLFNK